MPTLARPPAIATSPAPSDRECRELVRQALRSLNEAIPPGFWSWLEWRHPKYSIELTEIMPMKIALAWQTARLEPIVRDFLCAASAAIAVYQLNSQEKNR